MSLSFKTLAVATLVVGGASVIQSAPAEAQIYRHGYYGGPAVRAYGYRPVGYRGSYGYAPRYGYGSRYGYYRRGGNGGAVAAGLIGGLALGALATAATTPYYTSPYYGSGYYPSGYGYPSGYAYPGSYSRTTYYRAAPVCYYEPRRVIGPYGYPEIRDVRVCY